MTHGDACFAYFNKIWGIPSQGLAHKPLCYARAAFARLT
jgi:hypothetical protein